MSSVTVITVTGGAGQIAYSLLPLIARGAMLGPSHRVELRLLDVEPAMKVAEGVVLELQDGAFPLLSAAKAFSDPAAAFRNCDIAIMCGAMPRKPGMERKDLLSVNAKIFTEQGEIIAAVASPNCRVLVVGNPANTNALVLLRAAGGKLLPKNISALTRLDMNRAKYQVSALTGASVADVRNVIIWGNHSNTQVPDASVATVKGVPAESCLLSGCAFDDNFIVAVQQRGAEVLKARGLSSACSAAAAIVDHMRDWVTGTAPGEIVSMAVWSDGNPFGIPSGLFFSFPVTCADGNWKFADGIAINPAISARIATTTQELIDERDASA